MENITQTKDLEFKLIENIPFWASFKLEIAKNNGIEYHRKKGSKIVYKQSNDGFECINCGAEILVAQVAHPIHEGPSPLSGSGNCKYEQVPYCPNCEEKPRYNGSIITI